MSVYGLKAGGLESICAVGEAKPSQIAASHAIYKAAIGERRALSVLDADAEIALGGDGLAVVPIVLPPVVAHAPATITESGRVLGILKLDQADGAVLSDGLSDRLAVVARLLAPMLAEPRIIVDNTGPVVAPARLTQGWRHVSWQDKPQDDGCGTPRPRVNK